MPSGMNDPSVKVMHGDFNNAVTYIQLLSCPYHSLKSY